MFKQISDRLSEERRNNGRRSLIRTETMSVGGTHDRCFEQSVMIIDSLECFDNKSDETKVVHCSLTWCMKQNARIGGKRPVLMLSRTVYTLEGFFMQKTTETMFSSHTLHNGHHQHVVVNSKVCFLKNRSQLKLVGRYFVMACLARNTKLQRLNLNVFHELLHAGWNGTEVMVIHLLIFCRVMSHQGAPCHHKVRTCCKE